MAKSLGALILIGFLCVACANESERSATKPMRAAPSSSAPVDGKQRCPLSSVRPTYLPWLTPGEPIPTPTRSYDDAIERGQLSWTNPDKQHDGVGLTLYSLPGGVTPEKNLDVKVQGSVGYLHHGPEETGAWWDLGARGNFLELSIALDDTSQRQLDSELLRIARSLNRSNS
jgi:hypothetical protein